MTTIAPIRSYIGKYISTIKTNENSILGCNLSFIASRRPNNGLPTRLALDRPTTVHLRSVYRDFGLRDLSFRVG